MDEYVVLQIIEDVTTVLSCLQTPLLVLQREKCGNNVTSASSVGIYSMHFFVYALS